MRDPETEGSAEESVHLDREDIEPDPAARGTLYQTLARAFEHPTEQLHDALSKGRIQDGIRQALAETSLDIAIRDFPEPDSYRALSTRYNRLFILGHTTITKRTDGSVETEGPVVSLYESSHRGDATWETINVDLARAYEYYGLGVDTDERDHHDKLGLQLEFAGYLARREALGDRDASAARRDLLDRHLGPFGTSIHESLSNVDAGVYADLGAVLDRVIGADYADLDDRLDRSTASSEVSW